MRLRNYDPNTDKQGIHRIWREAGWLGKDERLGKAADLLAEHSRALVAEVNGEIESMALSMPATIRYLDQDLPFSGIIGVATSHVARKQGLASGLTALATATDAADGALVAGLGVFEQGYYNQLGFGNGSYEHWVAFDPLRLKIDAEARIPRRITADDWGMVHASRRARIRGHGSLDFSTPELTQADMLWTAGGLGLGYCDGPNGELTHHFWCDMKDAEHGPYAVVWISHQTPQQFLELMALLRNLGDQVRLVEMCEPQGIQLQDIIEQPFRQWQVTDESKESQIHTMAYWQMRICDLPGCLEQTYLQGEEARFNLVLADPIARFLDSDAPWRGVAGDYVVTLGPSSGAEPGTDGALPTLHASVGAFTRLWLGVRPASGLAVTDELSGPPELLERLDRILRLPDPKPGWDF